MKYSIVLILLFNSFVFFSCSSSKNESMENESQKDIYQFMTLDPGHFHAGLVQKKMLEGVSSTVYVFAPVGEDVKEHLKRIRGFNTRADNPTNWLEEVYTGPDFFEKMIYDKPGNIAVLSGNNSKKTEYIKKIVDAGINVLADKPMVINIDDFELLKEAFVQAEKNNVILYDIMTERHEITSIMQKELSQIPDLFGVMEKGSIDDPAITKESVHHFFKYVSGSPLKRPAWFFDVAQQGEGMVDITTHLVDLIQWACFPDQVIDYKKDIDVLSARRWATELTPSMFKKVTHLNKFPDYLSKDIVRDSILNVYSNAEINYTLRDVHAKVSVIWNYEAPEGAKDTHYSIIRGSNANLIIKQGASENYKATLFVEKTGPGSDADFIDVLNKSIDNMQSIYPGIAVEQKGNMFKINIPDSYKVGHEAHFTQVTEKYINYLKAGKLPEWEVPNMIAKYYTTTRAYEISR